MQTPVVFVLVLSISMSLVGQQAAPYPNELPGYRFHDGAKWRGLSSSNSTIREVEKLLGKPEVATDLEHPAAAYPGDANVSSVVLSYSQLMPDWEVLIYLRKSCGESGEVVLCSIDLIPRGPIPFLHMTFSTAFTKRHVDAVDAAWDEYSDGSGLRYEVFTTKPPYGKELPGDLNRISYGKRAAGQP